MYCPTCFNNTLKLTSRGVVRLSFNGKQKDTSLFLFNLGKDHADEIKKNAKEKIDEFFKWYSSFKSPDPIRSIELYSNDYACSNNCKIPLSTKITVISVLISQAELEVIAKEVADKYKITLDLKKNT